MREPTQSLQLEIPDAERDSHPSLAVGTRGDEHTKVESPSARNNPSSRPERASSVPPPLPRNPDDPELRLDQVLGTYRLMELLGKGGMGYVYRAEHTKLGREVALKLLRADYARRRDAVSRFFQEAKTVNRVRHRNIVDVTDFVELDDGTTFIIMELLRGNSLGKWSRSGVDLPRALAVLVQICDGLGAAHAVGVIHRDLKPDNVIVVPTSDGAEMVKLLDFGVAKLVNRDDEDVGFQTQAGSVIGTPAYMSPEQAGGMAVDQRSDIYSLGAIMYELFCGQPLFRGRSFGEYVRKHLTELPVPARQTKGGEHIDPQLEALIMRCLAKEPDQRFGHILELRDGLLHMLGVSETPSGVMHPPSGLYRQLPTLLAAQQLPPHLLPLPAPAPGMTTTVPTPPPHVQHIASQVSQPVLAYGYSAVAPAPPPRSTWGWFAGGALAVGLGVAAALFYVHTHGDPPPVAQAPVMMTPTVEPAPPEQPAQKPRQIELRFDSLPSAGIYAEGHSAELCRTPCAFNVDLADGADPDHRNFVVRSEGYVDKTLAVDLGAAQREFHITLEREPGERVGTVDTQPDRKHPTGKIKKPVVKTDVKPVVEDKPVADKSGDHPTRSTAESGAKVDDKPIKHDDALEKPERKADPTIDPTDTHDPFKKHK
ncbi:MAG TPA: serine/threonine-protein kinase [Kofleriaceae bacterium]|nr:serine/threonine-protein kinase [Kofleriaceae bacterium]